MQRPEDSSPEPVSVVVERATEVRTPDRDALTSLSEVAGSPFLGLCYRRSQGRNRTEGPRGTQTVQNQLILSLPGIHAGAVAINDVVTLPPCRITNGKTMQAKVAQVRPYVTGLQCDIETGAATKDQA